VYAAKDHGYPFARDPSEVQSLASQGHLVRLPGSRSYELKRGMRYPFARPEVRLFVERLSSQYRGRCGEKLVVTSLVRPRNRQPRNSSPLSVHPTGMAMDLRVPSKRTCRSWLEGTLLQLERTGVLEASRERYPPHYHVVLFPDDYRSYVERITGKPVVVGVVTLTRYRVRRGDTLWKIARRHGTTVREIQDANNLRSNLIRPGQVLAIPRR